MGAIAPLSIILTSSVSQTLSASSIYLLLKPIVQSSPSILAGSLSFAVPREVMLEILIILSPKTHLTGLLILSVIIREVLSILSIRLLVSTLMIVFVAATACSYYVSRILSLYMPSAIGEKRI